MEPVGTAHPVVFGLMVIVFLPLQVLKEAKESAYQSKFGQSMAVPESWRD